MKRTLSLLLAAIMVLSLASVIVLPAMAGDTDPEPGPDGTIAISTAEEFAKMDPQKDYSLAEDIVLDATYVAPENTPFAAKFDGKGHKITTTVPVFMELNGATIQNLVIEGEVVITDATTDGASVLANKATAVTFTNVVNNANLKVSAADGATIYVGTLVGSLATGVCAFTECVNNGNVDVEYLIGGKAAPRIGGLTGNNAKGVTVVYKDCVNNGNVTIKDTAETVTTGALYAGGIAAGTFGSTYLGCINNGNVTSNTALDGGGIVGRSSPSKQNADQSVTFRYCVNNGNITAGGNAGTRGLGGMLGYASSVDSPTKEVITVDHCINTGAITASGETALHQLGGLVGYVYGSKDRACAIVTYSINTGDVTSNGTSFVGEFVGYTNSPNTTMKFNIGTGTLTTNPRATDNGEIPEGGEAKVATLKCFVGCSSSTPDAANIVGNYITDNAGLVYYTFATAAENVANCIKIGENDAKLAIVPAAQATTGEIVTAVNTAAGETVFVQLGEKINYANLVIDSAVDYANIVSGINYKLDADIAINQTVAYAGEFDGNGHTVTISVPMFKDLEANSTITVKNLVIAGKVEVATGYAAALFTKTGTGCTVTLDNIVNNAEIISNDTSSSGRAGGLIAVINGTAAKGVSTATVTNCINNGNVTGAGMVGGIIAYMQTNIMNIDNCVNNGKVTDVAGLAGGIMGRFGDDSAFDTSKVINMTNCVNNGEVAGTSNVAGILAYAKGVVANITSCVNNGAVTTAINDAGGICGHAGAKSYLTTITIEKCVNTGTITNLGTTANDTGVAAGILAYVYGSGSTGVGKLNACVNLGEIKTPKYAGQLFGYSNQILTEIKNSIAGGKITAITSDAYKDEEGKALPIYAVVLGCSSVGVSDKTASYNCVISGLFYIENDGTEWYSYATSDANAINRIYLDKKYEATIGEGDAAMTYANEAFNTVKPGAIVRFGAADLISGKLTYLFNQAAGENILFQTIGTDLMPVLDATHGIVYLNGDKYTNTAPAGEETTAQGGEETTVPGGDDTTVPGGDDTTVPGGDDTTVPGGDDTTVPGGDETTPVPGGDETTATPDDTTKGDDTSSEGGDEAGCAGCGGFAIAAEIVVVLTAILGVALIKKNA